MRYLAIIIAATILCAVTVQAKEKNAPAPGIVYAFLDETATPALAAELIGKGLKIAFLFRPGQQAWIKTMRPALKGTRPLLLVRGDLKPAETAELKKTLDLFEYDMPVLHIKMTAGDGMGVVPVSDLMTIERVEDYDNKWIDFELRRGAGQPERAVLQSKQDKNDFGDPFTVAGGMIFKRSKVCLVSLDRPGATLPKRMEVTVVFAKDAEKLKKIPGR